MINKQKKGITYNPKYHSEEQQDISSSKNFYQKFWYGLIKRHYYYLTSGSRVLPSFFVIGGVRCGTTSFFIIIFKFKRALLINGSNNELNINNKLWTCG